MSQEGRRGEVKAVSFKMPLHIWSVVHAAAAARGVDVSSVLNWVIAQNLPVLVRLQAQRDAALAIAKAEGMAAAVKEGLQRIAVEDGPEAAARSLLNLLRQLQAMEPERRGREEGDGLSELKAG